MMAPGSDWERPNSGSRVRVRVLEPAQASSRRASVRAASARAALEQAPLEQAPLEQAALEQAPWSPEPPASLQGSSWR